MLQILVTVWMLSGGVTSFTLPQSYGYAEQCEQAVSRLKGEYKPRRGVRRAAFECRLPHTRGA